MELFESTPNIFHVLKGGCSGHSMRLQLLQALTGGVSNVDNDSMLQKLTDTLNTVLLRQNLGGLTKRLQQTAPIALRALLSDLYPSGTGPAA